MISRFTETYEQRHSLARKWKQEGRKIFGYAYALVPEELIHAAGIIPVHLTEEGATAKGEEFIPEYFCDYSHSVLGQVLEGIYDYLDGVIIPDACVPFRTAGEVWELYLKPGFFYHYLNYPHRDFPQARDYVLKEFHWLKQRIEEFCGQKISEQALRSTMDIYNKNRELLHKVYQFRGGEQSSLSGSEVCEVVKAGLVIPKEEYNQMLEGLLKELAGQQRKTRGKVRLMVSSVIWEELANTQVNFLRIIEEAGGEIVCDDLTTGHRYFREPAPLKADLMEALVDRYWGKAPVAFKMPVKVRAEILLQEALKYGANGAIFFVPKYCQSSLLHIPQIESRFKEKGINTLVLESTDEMPEAPVRTRIQAFLEML